MPRTIDPAMMYVAVDTDGRAVAFYAPDIHGDAIPTEAVEIDRETWETWIADTQGQRWTGKKLASFTPPPATGSELEALKSRLSAAVDAEAEDLRLTLITPGAGQAMEYQEAYAQAKAAIAAGPDAEASDYPMLAASIGIDIDPKTKKPSVDVLGEARAVMAAYEAYLLAGAAIRKARLQGKFAIGAAETEVDVRAAAEAIHWPSFG